jgi:hypothetical protein
MMRIHGFGYRKMINPLFFTPYSPPYRGGGVFGVLSGTLHNPKSINLEFLEYLIPVPY